MGLATRLSDRIPRSELFRGWFATFIRTPSFGVFSARLWWWFLVIARTAIGMATDAVAAAEVVLEDRLFIDPSAFGL